MTRDMVIGFIGQDQPGIVQQISRLVSDHGGNWMDSRMSELGGFFSGLARIEIDAAQFDALERDLGELYGVLITVQDSVEVAINADALTMKLNIIGPDRKGILSEVSQRLADRGVNVMQMDTSVAPAPMSGEPLFTADAEVIVPAGVDVMKLSEDLDAIANELGVDVLIEEIV